MRNDPIPASDLIDLVRKDEDVGILDMLDTVWRAKGWMIIGGLAALAAAAVYTVEIAVPMYRSSTVVALESRDEQILDFESVVSSLSADTATVNTEVEVLRARILVGKLVDALDLTADPEFNEALRPPDPLSVDGLKVMILGVAPPLIPMEPRIVRDRVVTAVLDATSITNQRNSYVFRISVETEEPAKSARIADTLAELYIRDQLETKFQATEQATAWLSARVTDLQSELEAAENAVKDYNTSTDLVGPGALAALNRQLKDLRGRLVAGERALEAATQRIATMEAVAATGAPVAMAAASGDSMLTALVAQARAGSDAMFQTRFDSLLSRLRLERDRAAAEIETMQASVAEQRTRVDAQSRDLLALEQLQREAAASGLIYEYFLSRLKETSVQQGIQQADSRILSYAVMPLEPSKPRSGIILSVAGVAGLGLGLGLFLLRDMRQTGFRSAEDTERAAGVTVIGQIPRAPAVRRRRILDYIVTKPNSAMVEAVRNLRTSILLSNVDEPPKVIVLTSSVPGEGKTTQSIALAHNLAGLGQRVLLIEGDIRRRTFRQYFDIAHPTGLLTAVAGEVPLADIAAHDPKLGVDILVGERSSVNAADFFSSDRFRAFLDEARMLYDAILIDTPPVLVVPDARVIAKMADAVVYVVHWDRTPRVQVNQGLHAFDTVDIPVTGLVLNHIDPHRMKRYGGRYSESYAAYGAKYYRN